MIDQNETLKHIAIMKQLIGETIYSISNSQYYFNGEIDHEDIGDLEIQTDSGVKVCLTLLGDGESVGAYVGSLNIPASFEVADGETASWRKLSILNSYDICGNRIVAVQSMCERSTKLESSYRAGWRVYVSGGDYFVFYNCDDNSRLFYNEEPSLIQGFVTTWNSI